MRPIVLSLLIRRLAGALFALAASASFAQITTYIEGPEPNNPCTLAQDMFGAQYPLRIEGFKSSNPADAVDFYRFYGPPGETLFVQAASDLTKGGGWTTGIGLWTSACENAASTISWGDPATLAATFPADGIVIVGVTAAFDSSFSGSGTIDGAYVLSAQGGTSSALKSISGLVVDKVTGKPLSGSADPFAAVYLYRVLPGDQLEPITGTALSPEGAYAFTSNSAGVPLPPGSYSILAYADQYQSTNLDVIDVKKDEARVAATVKLPPNPVRITDVRACDALPASGGTCNFSFKANLGEPRILRGDAWSMVTVGNLSGLPLSWSMSEACRQPMTLVARGPVAARTVLCSVFVPATVPIGGYVCAAAFFGEGMPQEQRWNIRGLSDAMFCVYKVDGASTLKVMPQQKAIQLQRSRRFGGFR